MSSNVVSPFLRPASSYQRNVNVLGQYREQVALYLSIKFGKTIDECREYVVKNLKADGKFPFVDPMAYYLERQDNGDRIKQSGPLSKYIGEAVETKSLIAATFTIYHPPTKVKSYLVDFIDMNVKKRGIAKKAMFKAEMEGNKVLQAIKKAEQNNKKTNNNSISGGHAQASTPLFNKTTHSTLTSTCRSTSGYGNANNEKLLTGNRHYWSPHIVRNNITSIVSLVDMEDMKRTIEKFGLCYPTVDDVINCITYSTDLYWRSDKEISNIRDYVSKLSDVQRAAFVYVGDFYHIAKLNDKMFRVFLDKLTTCSTDPLDGHQDYMKGTIEEYRNLAVLMHPEITKGLKADQLAAKPEYAIVAGTAKNIENVLIEYSDFINTICMSRVVPASLASFPDSIRRSALTSDTDSTIFTVQDWCQWHRGYMGVDKPTNATADVMVFLAAQSIVHVLACMSANFGIEEKRMFQIAMKNEFKFDVFVPTQLAKHYFALISSQEGNLFKEYKEEKKGVHLKSSNAPKKVMKQANDTMRRFMDEVISGKKIKLMSYLKEVGDVERAVYESIKHGHYEFFRVQQIKQENSYGRSAMESNYWHYLFWQEVWAPKYGETQEPPYLAVKVSIGLNSPTKLRNWMDSFEDRELAERMAAFMKKSNRDKLSTVWLPEQCIANSVGIPPEILSQVDTRKIVFDTTAVFYKFLEGAGIYSETKKNVKLISDFY